MTSCLRNSFLGCNAGLNGCALTNNSYMETVTYILKNLEIRNLVTQNLILFFPFLCMLNAR